MRIAVIIPTLDEAAIIVDTLLPLAALRETGHMVIVADGGSSDGTRELARTHVDRIIDAPRGRSRQMNAGAAAAMDAEADVYLFLHADSILPAGAGAAIAAPLTSG